MKNICYNIHNWFKIKISSLSWHSVRAFNCQYSYFEARDCEDPDFDVEVGDFIPDLRGCYSLDHKYFIKKDFIYFEDSDKALNWKVQIEGMDRNRIRIKYFTSKWVYLKFPWMLFPDLILHLYILQPLLEVMLFKKGLLLLHAGAFHRDGKAYLIAGRGGSHKTNLMLELMKKGYDYISDDMVILSGKEVFSFPHSISLFDFLHRYLGREEMNAIEKIKLFLFLRKNHPLSFNVVDRAPLKGLTLLVPTNRPEAKIVEGVDLREMLRMLYFNQGMERISYVSHKTVIGKYFDAYEFIFPESTFFPEQEKWEERCKESFMGTPYRVLEIPIQWQSHFAERLLTE